MKKVLKIIGYIFLVAYLVIAVGVTACLMCYNDYSISEYKDYSLIKVEDKSLNPDYNKGDLVIVKKNAMNDVKVNDMAFFYNVYENVATVNYGKITKVEYVNETEATYEIDGNKELSREFFIGTSKTAKSYSKIGSVLNVFESRFGYLGLFVLPMLVAFIYEIYVIVKELRNPNKDE